jgi:hypothetical protein
MKKSEAQEEPSVSTTDSSKIRRYRAANQLVEASGELKRKGVERLLRRNPRSKSRSSDSLMDQREGSDGIVDEVVDGSTDEPREVGVSDCEDVPYVSSSLTWNSSDDTLDDSEGFYDQPAKLSKATDDLSVATLELLFNHLTCNPHDTVTCSDWTHFG